MKYRMTCFSENFTKILKLNCRSWCLRVAFNIYYVIKESTKWRGANVGEWYSSRNVFFLSSIQFIILQWTLHNTLVKDVNATAQNFSINSSSEKFVKFQGKEQRRSLLGDKVWASECCFSNFPRRLLTMLNFAASEIKFNNIMGLN